MAYDMCISDGTGDYIIPPGFFDIPKKVDIPYCPKRIFQTFHEKVSLRINTIFVLSGSLRKLSTCLN